MEPKHVPFVIERARAEDGAALLQYLKIIGGETNNLSFGPEGVPLSVEAEEAYLRVQEGSADNVQYLARVDGEIIGTASLNRKPNRMRHCGEFGISLKKAWWGCGAASALMEAILAFARENGFEQLNLEVRPRHPAVREVRLPEAVYLPSLFQDRRRIYRFRPDESGTERRVQLMAGKSAR